MNHVFISYKTEDRKKAQSVRVALRAELGCEVWWDQDLQTGGQFSQDIDAALSSAACVVVLWSKRSVQSQWVQQEAAVAKALGILAPAQIDDCLIPPPYAGIQAAHLINWRGDEKDPEFAKLASRVKACLENHSSSRSPSTEAHSPPATAELSPREESRGEPIGADAGQSLRVRINLKIAILALVLLLTGSLVGFVAHETILKAAQFETVPSSKQLGAEIESLKKEKIALEIRLASTSPPPPDPNERVLYYKAQILILRGNIEGLHNTQMEAKKNTQETDSAVRAPVLRDSVLQEVLRDNILRQRARQLADLIGAIAEDQLRPAVKIIQHEYGGWAYLMAGSSYGQEPPKYLSTEVRIEYATKAVAKFNLTLDLMDDIKSKYEGGKPDAIPIYKWMTGDSEDVNRTHYLKAIALAVMARAGGGAPQAAIVELNEFVAPAYLEDFPAAANPDLAWVLTATSAVK